MLHRVPIRLIDDLWPAVEPHAKASLASHPFLDADDLHLILKAGRAVLWLITGPRGVIGFAAAEVVLYPRCRVVNVLAAGGVRGVLKSLGSEFATDLEKYAREQGADVISITGRPGWKRFTRPMGSRTWDLSVAWKELTHEWRRRQRADDNHGPEGGPVGTSTTVHP